ncbi:MAG: DUF418 domain-containing protein [Parafilimonas sp.]
MNTAQPITQAGRTTIVDIIRGCALFGVLVANIASFLNFALPKNQIKLLISTTPDKLTDHFISLFVDGKFITIFSMLFGYGFGVLMERVSQKGMHANLFFIRRMIILLLFAAIHIAIWWGEILNVYAMAGLLMLLFRNVKTKNLIWCGLFLLFIVGPFIHALKIIFLPPAGERLNILFVDYNRSVLSGNMFSIAKSNYTLVFYLFVERWSQWRDVAEALGKFLLGYYVFRKGFLKDIFANIRVIKKVFRIALVIAVIYLIKKIIVEIIGVTVEGKAFSIIDYLFSNIGVLSLSLVYCTSLIQIYNYKKNKKLFMALASVGMMSLTNYLTQTAFYCFFFYGFGLSMMGKLHMQWTIPLAVCIFTLQIFFSVFWMKRFQFGFAEWIWRMLSYNKYIALRK